MDSALLGAEFGAHAISHCEEVSDEGIQAMAEKQIFAVLLPSTAYLLRLKPPPARQMIDAGSDDFSLFSLTHSQSIEYRGSGGSWL